MSVRKPRRSMRKPRRSMRKPRRSIIKHRRSARSVIKHRRSARKPRKSIRKPRKSVKSIKSIKVIQSEPVTIDVIKYKINLSNSKLVNHIEYQNKDQIKEDIKNLTNNILIVLYYANWCGPCKQFKPIYLDLYNKMSTNSKVKIRQIDADKNKVNEKIESFPTIILYSKTYKKKYVGNRTTTDLIKFMSDNLKI